MQALVLVAHGSEEMETVIVCDILHRAGVKVVKASVEGEYHSVLECANGIKLVANAILQDIRYDLSEYDIIILPGGSVGSDSFCSNEHVQEALKYFAAESKYVAAICAAPQAIREAEIFKGSRITCYPGLEKVVTRDNFYVLDASINTVVDGRLITSRGPGTAMDFALTIVKVLLGEKIRAKVARDLLLD